MAAARTRRRETDFTAFADRAYPDLLRIA